MIPPFDCLLHDHGDGAEPLGRILPTLLAMDGISVDLNRDYAQEFRNNFIKVHANILEAFSNINKLLQTWDALYLAALNHVRYRAQQGFVYDEVMFAPQYHVFKGLTEREAVEALVAGIKQGECEYPGIEVNLLFAIGRELRPKKAIRLLKILEHCDRNYVVRANIVCDENKFPPERHSRTFEYADAAGINFEFHASEWVRRPKQAPDFQRDLPMLGKNLRFVMELYRKSRSKTKKRIGHGIALPYNPDLMRMAVDLQIPITGCPASNLQGKNIPDLEALRIRDMLRAGVLWSMNPDDDFFQPNLSGTFKMCHHVYKFTDAEIQQIADNARKSGFGNRKPL